MRPALECRHAHYYVEWADQTERMFRGQDPGTAFDRFERERENLRAALTFLTSEGDSSRSLRLAGTSAYFWLMRGPLVEASERLRAALATSSVTDRTPQRAKALNRMAGVAREQGDDDAARRCFEESLSIYRELGDHYHVGNLVGNFGELEFNAGHLDAAQGLIEESLQTIRELGDWYNVGYRLAVLGAVRLFLGHVPQAQRHFEESLAIARSTGGESGQYGALRGLALVALRLDRVTEARERILESQQVGEKYIAIGDLISSLEDLAVVAAVQGQAGRSLRLAAAADAQRDSSGIKLPAVWRHWYDGYLASARQALSGQELALAWTEGKAMTLDEAIIYSRRIDAA